MLSIHFDQWLWLIIDSALFVGAMLQARAVLRLRREVQWLLGVRRYAEAMLRAYNARTGESLTVDDIASITAEEVKS